MANCKLTTGITMASVSLATLLVAGATERTPAFRPASRNLGPLPQGEVAVTSHGPYETGDCGLCHKQSDPRAPGVLARPVAELCLGCHDDFKQVLGRRFAHAAAQDSCVNCHNPHNSKQREMAVLQREFAGKPVHWAAIVTDRAPQAAVESMAGRASVSMPVLLDDGDTLYGRFGVALFPVAGITDRAFRLAYYEPFSKVHYPSVIRARIRYLLGDIDEGEMKRAVAPPAAVETGDTDIARRFLKLAEMLFQAGNYEKAAESVRRSIEKDETVVAAHVLLGKVLAAQGKCSDAADLGVLAPAPHVSKCKQVLKGLLQVRGRPNGVEPSFDLAGDLHETEFGFLPSAVLVTFRNAMDRRSLRLLALRGLDWFERAHRDHPAVILDFEFEQGDAWSYQ